MWFEIYESPKHERFGNSITCVGFEWRWRLRARNGRILADGSEAYSSKANVRRAVDRLTSVIISTQHRLPIKEVEA